MKRLKNVEEIIAKAIYGQYPSAKFEVAPELTKERTVLLYQQILSSHLYLHYATLQSYALEHSQVTESEIRALINGLEETKRKRRY